MLSHRFMSDCSTDLTQRSWISRFLFFCLFTSTYWTPPCHLTVNSTFLWMFRYLYSFVLFMAVRKEDHHLLL